MHARLTKWYRKLWIAWRHLTCKLTTARKMCDESYMRRRLVGLLACFVTWVTRYRQRKWLWQLAVPFRIESLRRAKADKWNRWRAAYIARLEVHEQISNRIQAKDRDCLRKHFKSWHRRAWIHRQATNFQLSSGVKMKRCHLFAWADRVARRKYIEKMLVQHYKSHLQRQISKGIRTWRRHFRQTQSNFLWQIQSCQAKVVRPCRQLLATKRQYWMLWKVFVAEERHAKTALVESYRYYHRRLRRRVWQHWLLYCHARSVRHGQNSLADKHFRLFRLKRTVSKLRDHWYVRRLLLSVDQEHLRRHFRAWAAQRVSIYLFRQRAVDSRTYMEKWREKVAVRLWRRKTHQRRFHDGQKAAALRVYRFRLLTKAWFAWNKHKEKKSQQAKSCQHIQLRWGLTTWRRHLGIIRRDHQTETRSRNFNRNARLATVWRSWLTYNQIQKNRMHLLGRLRQRWFQRWLLLAHVQRHRRKHDFALLRTAFSGWLRVQRQTLTSQVGLCRLLQRLIQWKVVTRWTRHVRVSKLVQHQVAEGKRRLLAICFQNWYHALTVAALGRYHATHRHRQFIRKLFRRWFCVAEFQRRQRSRQRRICRQVFAVWFAFTYIQQATTSLQQRVASRVIHSCFKRWKQVLQVVRYVRLAKAKRLRRWWLLWFDYAKERQHKAWMHQQLERVQRQNAKRSSAFEQTLRMKEDLLQKRIVMRNIIRAWYEVSRYHNFKQEDDDAALLRRPVPP
ncbi:hypothetical protein AeRB84_004821 [Aphanomyces euteiches]|nr:hypothetical protein AeRB84_004821 [Aphanomyces euteiches]